MNLIAIALLAFAGTQGPVIDHVVVMDWETHTLTLFEECHVTAWNQGESNEFAAPCGESEVSDILIGDQENYTSNGLAYQALQLSTVDDQIERTDCYLTSLLLVDEDGQSYMTFECPEATYFKGDFE